MINILTFRERERELNVTNMAEDRLESYKKTLEEMKRLTGSMEDAMKAKKKEAEAIANQSRQRLEATTQQVRNEIKHQPKWLDHAMDMEVVMASRSSGKRLDPREVMVNKWDDGNGNILFASGGVGPDQIPDLSARIQAQHDSFNTLNPEKQTQIRSAFQLLTPDESTKPYQDFLKSEALGKRFQELKQQNLTPP